MNTFAIALMGLGVTRASGDRLMRRLEPNAQQWEENLYFLTPGGVGVGRCEEGFAHQIFNEEECLFAVKDLGYEVSSSESVDAWGNVCGCSFNPKNGHVQFNQFAHPKFCYDVPQQVNAQNKDSTTAGLIPLCYKKDPQPTCYLEYCNAHSDLMNAFCGGAQCTDRVHYNACKSHWEAYRGVNLQTRTLNPETCKPITLEDLFCPPMQDVSGQWCRNVLSPPVQDKTEEECKELCRTNPKCLWAATGPSHCQNCNYEPFPLKNIPSSSPAPLIHVRRSQAPNGKCPVVTRTPTAAPITAAPMNDLSSLRSYEHLSKACVYGGNIVTYADKSVEECRDLCDREESCKAFQYGVAHGGHKGSYQPRDCQLQSYSYVGTCNVYVKPEPVTLKCNMRPGPLARMDLNKDFRIHLQVTADQDWVQAGSGGGGIFGFRDGARAGGGNFGLYARFNGGLHYAIHAGDITGRAITTGSYGQPTFYKYPMNLGQTYDMIIEWTGALFTWTIDGETVLSRDAPNGFGSHHHQTMMCYGVGGGAKGFKGTVKVLQME